MDQVLMVLFIYYLWPARNLYALKHGSQIPNCKKNTHVFSLHYVYIYFTQRFHYASYLQSAKIAYK